MKQCSVDGGHGIVVQRIVLISCRDNTSLRWRGFLSEKEEKVDDAGERWLAPSNGERAEAGGWGGWGRAGGLERGRRRGGLSKFRLNSPRINIRNGTPGCHKLACCPLLSFPDSTICTPGPVTVYHKLRLFFIIVLPVDIEELETNFDYGRSRNFTLSR